MSRSPPGKSTTWSVEQPRSTRFAPLSPVSAASRSNSSGANSTGEPVVPPYVQATAENPPSRNRSIRVARTPAVNRGWSHGSTMQPAGRWAAAALTPHAIEVPTPSAHRGLVTRRTGRSATAAPTASAAAPITTNTGLQPASSAARAARRTRGSPSIGTNCLGRPSRVEPPAASTTAAMGGSSLTATGRGSGRRGRADGPPCARPAPRGSPRSPRARSLPGSARRHRGLPGRRAGRDRPRPSPTRR